MNWYEVLKSDLTPKEKTDLLDKQGFRLVTYGWDEIKDGLYCEWNDQINGLTSCNPHPLEYCYDDDILDDFYYRHTVTESDIELMILEIDIIEYSKNVRA